MKWLLTKIGLPKAIGLYIDDDAVTLSQVVATPLGPVEITRQRENAGPDELPATLQRLLGPLLGRRRFWRAPVAIGLPARRSYFATRPIQIARGDLSPEVLLREALRSQNISVDNMVVDVLKAKPDERPVAAIVSCDRKYLTGLLESLGGCAVRLLRAEPAPCALLRAAAKRHRAGRGATVVIRLFLSDTQTLAVLAVNDLPIVWRFSRLATDRVDSAIVSAIRVLLTVSKDCGIESPLDAVMLHGREALASQVDVDRIKDQLGVPIKWFDGPALDDSQVAFGLALGCLDRNQWAFDLAQSLKSRAPLWELLRWRETALQAVLVMCMALFLAYRCWTLNESYTSVRMQNAQHLWMASTKEPELQKEKEHLEQKVAALNRFLDSRITWTSYERSLSECLPPNVYFTSFEGDCELASTEGRRGSAKPKESLVLRAAVSIPPDGLIPHEIDRFLNVLREHRLLKRDFPVVELADLKQLEPRANEPPIAMLTVICLPKGKKKKGSK